MKQFSTLGLVTHLALLCEAAAAVQAASTQQNNAPWGLGRISSTASLSGKDPLALDYQYTYDDLGSGAGVDIYVLSTGINLLHEDLGGRASLGTVFGGLLPLDTNGAGTHCAGAAAGLQFGAAKRAALISVKTQADDGTGTAADLAAGLKWVQARYRASHRPSIAVVPYTLAASVPVDAAAADLISAGVHVVAAAGDAGADTNTASPAGSPRAVVVAASGIDDGLAPFSNYGSSVTLAAPGVDVISASIPLVSETKARNSTSASACYVAGLVANVLSERGNQPPAAMKSLIQSMALQGVLSGLPAGTANRLAHQQPSS